MYDTHRMGTKRRQSIHLAPSDGIQHRYHLNFCAKTVLRKPRCFVARRHALRTAPPAGHKMKSTDTRPVISIVMPCFNAAGYLPTSVASVIAQTLPDWELIVVDDGSTDHSSDWLRSQRDPRIRVIQQTNQGVGSARNAGLACAQAHYVAFLDADDAWAPHFLETMLAALKAQPHAVLAYCGWQNLGLMDGRGQPFIPPEYETPHKHETLFANCRWPIHAAMTLRSKVLEVGGFSHTLKNAEDYALWLEVAAQAPIVRVPEVLAYYHFHSGEQASSNKLRAALQLLNAQKSYLRKHPDFFCNMGRT